MDVTVLLFLSSGLFLGWSLGANDAANVFGTAVGTRMVRFATAAAICGGDLWRRPAVVVQATTSNRVRVTPMLGINPDKVCHIIVKAREFELTRQAHHLFVTLLGAQERLEAVQAAYEDIDALNRLVMARESAGVQSQYDVLRVQIESARLDTRVETSRAAAAETASALAVLVGISDWHPRASGTLRIGNVDADPDSLWERAENEHPLRSEEHTSELQSH